MTDRADRPISDDRKRRAYIHSGSEAGLRVSLAVHTLIDQAHAQDLAILDECLVHRHPRPDLHCAARHQLRAYPLVELADGKHQPIFLVEETRRVGQFERVVSNAQNLAKRPQAAIAGPQSARAPAGAHRIEQVHHLLVGNRGGHGNLCGIQIREAGPNAARARNDSGDAETNVVGALIADDLQWHARRGLALDRRAAIVVEQLARKRGEKTARGRPKADAGNVNVDARALDGGLFSSGQECPACVEQSFHQHECTRTRSYSVAMRASP